MRAEMLAPAIPEVLKSFWKIAWAKAFVAAIAFF